MTGTQPGTVTQRVGLRRLFVACGLGLNEANEIHEEFRFGDVTVELYLGYRPKYNVSFSSSGKYIVPGKKAEMFHWETKSDPSQTPHAGELFTEMTCFSELAVNADLVRRFRGNDQEAQKELMRLARDASAVHSKALDVVSGALGLRFHRQLVLELLHEELIIPREKDWTVEFVGPGVELLESGRLNDAGARALRELMPAIGRCDAGALDRAASVFFWLLRAWAQRDPLSKFVALFIPLEMLLQGVTLAPDAEAESAVEQIRKLISGCDYPDSSRLLRAFDQLVGQRSPSLNQRFEILAKQAQMPHWEQDIEAFCKFNKMRNRLLHHGENALSLAVEVEAGVQPLEDLVERYISKALFGDGQVYATRWRPRWEVGSAKTE